MFRKNYRTFRYRWNMNKSELNLPLIFTWRDIFKTEAHSLIKYSIKKSEGQKEEKKAQFKGE